MGLFGTQWRSVSLKQIVVTLSRLTWVARGPGKDLRGIERAELSCVSAIQTALSV